MIKNKIKSAGALIIISMVTLVLTKEGLSPQTQGWAEFLLTMLVMVGKWCELLTLCQRKRCRGCDRFR